MLKKFIFSGVLLGIVSFAFCQNKNGIVINKIVTTAMGSSFNYIFIDTDNDKIADACIALLCYHEEGIEYFENLVLLSYIKIGSTIVFNFDREETETGLFLGDGQCIVSIDGVTRNRFFPLK
jgi:hypothetical protein